MDNYVININLGMTLEKTKNLIEKEVKKRIEKELSKKYNSQDNIKKKDFEKEIRAKIEEEVRENLRCEIIESIEKENNKKTSVFNDIEDKEIRDFFEKKLSQILVSGMDYKLSVGKIGQEVFERVGKKGSRDGLYTKWVTLSGFDEKTMKRYRNRWEVYCSVGEKIKPQVVSLEQKYIDKIVRSSEDKKKIYYDKKLEYNEFLKILKSDEKIINEDSEKISKNFDLEKLDFFIKNPDFLEKDKKNKFYKLLRELNNLITSK